MPEKPFKNLVVFSDLDGTLLDHTTYDFTPALEGIHLLKKHSIPLILVSSKTALEMAYWQDQLGLNDPYIAENGSIIVLPGEKKRVFLGKPLQELKTIFHHFAEGLPLILLLDHPARFQKETGLKEPLLSMALKREGSLPFLIEGGEEDKVLEAFLKDLPEDLVIRKGGRLYHLMGNTHKGRGVNWIQKHYLASSTKTIAFGDAENDWDLLKAVDYAYLVEKPSGGWRPMPGPIPSLRQISGIGPIGFTHGIKELLGLS